jgi:hypothetical protein
MSLNCHRLLLFGSLGVLLDHRAELGSVTHLVAVAALGSSQNWTCHLGIPIEVRKRPNKVGGIFGFSLASIVTHLTERLLGSRRRYLLVVVRLVRHLKLKLNSELETC